VGRYDIPDPLTYCSTGRAASSDPSCIDYSLPIGAEINEPKGALGYWPDYARITPNQRANYLRWMASGRTSVLEDIGYVFIFFYGLERRVLVDGADVRPVVTELVRLLAKYPFSGSFNSYASDLIAWIAAKGGVDHLAENWFSTLAGAFFRIGSQPMALALAWLHVHQRPLPPELALSMASQDARFPRSVVAQRLPEQFENLFRKKYTAAYGKGLLLQCAKRPLQIGYRPATASWDVRSSSYLTSVEIPNVMGIPSQFNGLVDIWNETIDELKPLSRKLAKGIEVNTREAYDALPEQLRAELDHPDKSRWDAVVAARIVKEGLALLQSGDLAAINGIAPQPRLTLKQSTELAQTANYVGYMLVPDARVTGSAYGWSDLVGLVRPQSNPVVSADPSFRSATMMLQIGMAMAASDGNVTAEEVHHITQILETQFKLPPDDVLQLWAHREVLMVKPPSIRVIGAKLKAVLSRDQLGMLCRFLVGVAAADGRVPKDEVKALKFAYSAMGVEETELLSLLQEISSSSDTAVEIATADKAIPGEAIPDRPDGTGGRDIVIDHERVQRLMDETKEVSRMLGEAMQDIMPENEPIISVAGPGVTADLTTPTRDEAAAAGDLDGVPASALEQLDRRYHHILRVLLSRDEWPRDEFERLVRQEGLMPSGTVESINTWSDENLGDFLIDEAEAFTINKGILEGTR
jgi:uncharacterized tellurite resistance protein B-like protein